MLARRPERCRAPPRGQPSVAAAGEPAACGLTSRYAKQRRPDRRAGTNVDGTAFWPDFFWVIATLTAGIVLRVNCRNSLCAQTDGPSNYKRVNFFTKMGDRMSHMDGRWAERIL
jgi:hypothetical protein